MLGFNGFPDGKQEIITLPVLFFSELLPKIDNYVELKVTLYCFWALHAQEGKYRYVRFSEVCTDNLFLNGISNSQDEAVQLIREGFERAVARGTLLQVSLQLETGEDVFYFVNTEKGRQVVDAIKSGRWLPDDKLRPISLTVEQPNIYLLYEQNIGMITPLVAEELKDLERTYSSTWIKDAIEIAVKQGVHNLRYIITILQRWEREGRGVQARQKTQTHEEYIQQLRKRYAKLFK